MRSTSALVVFALAASTLGADDKPVKLPPSSEAAKKGFKAAIAKAEDEYNKAVNKAADEYKAQLKVIQEGETKGGNLDAAVAVREEVKRITEESLPLFEEGKDAPTAKGKLVAGTWDMTYIQNKATRTYVFKTDGDLSFVEEKKSWKVKKVGDAFVTDHGEGHMARYTFAGGRVFEEMYESKAKFDKETPSMIGIGTLRKK